jgi:isopenicillin-N N-acyltransferase-like protein
MNAIRAPGVNFSALPVHLAQRVALNKTSKKEALDRLTSLGIAAAVHVLVADSTGATSLESSALDLVKLEMKKGRIAHSNHFLAEHDPGVCDAVFFPDSRSRMERVTALLDQAETMLENPSSASGFTAVEKILADEDGFPTAINRKSSPGNGNSTLFSIVMDLNGRTAVVKLGRPTENEGIFLLKPGDSRLRTRAMQKR